MIKDLVRVGWEVDFLVGLISFCFGGTSCTSLETYYMEYLEKKFDTGVFHLNRDISLIKKVHNKRCLRLRWLASFHLIICIKTKILRSQGLGFKLFLDNHLDITTSISLCFFHKWRHLARWHAFLKVFMQRVVFDYVK